MQFYLRVASLFLATFALSLSLLAADTQSTKTNPADNAKLDDHPSTSEVTIPGPLRSFERMAGISQKVPSDQVLRLLARNVYVQGYVGWQDAGSPTEYLILLGRYVNQARELAALAGPDQVIHISGCNDVTPLLRSLGYRLRGECGQSDATLVTAEEERAFLTVDSGFPLPGLEDSLRRNEAFSYPYPSSQVPMLFTEQDWSSALKPGRRRSYNKGIEFFLYHPAAARLYWSLSRMDPESRGVL